MIPVVLGLLFGASLVAIARLLFPPRTTLVEMLASLEARPEPEPIALAVEPGWAARTGRRFAPALAEAGLPRASLRRDLATLGRDPRTHLAEQATAALAGLLLPPLLLLAVSTVTGVSLGAVVPAATSLLGAVAFFFVPDLSVRTAAAKRREEMRHTLSVFLDLTVVSLAGGAGVEQSLADAGSVIQSRSAAQLRHALEAARLTRVAPWGPLGRLGDELGVDELRELAATVSLAGSEGAKVRASLAAKAAALRTRQLADTHSDAQQATERMALPLILLFAGFLIFIGYPALSRVLEAL